jgi:hypothetical protein
MMEEDYIDNAFCKKCGKDTPHVIHSAGHERDSSWDYKECAVCGTRKYGMERE